MRIKRLAFISALIAAVVAAVKIKKDKEAESSGDDTLTAEPGSSTDPSDA